MQFHLEKSLLDYLIATDDMQKDTARYNPKYVELFNDLDLHWRNEVLRGELDLDPIAAFLLGHSYFLWLASVRTALSGHSMSVFPVLRTSLESACYGYMVAHDPSARRCWLDRDQSPETFKKFRRRFNQAIAGASKLIAVEHEPVASSITNFYDGTIMFGGHPNPRFLLDHVRTGDGGTDRVPITLTCLNAPESPNTTRTLTAAAEGGLLISTVNALCFTEHPRDKTIVISCHAIQEKMQQVFGIVT